MSFRSILLLEWIVMAVLPRLGGAITCIAAVLFRQTSGELEPVARRSVAGALSGEREVSQTPHKGSIGNDEKRKKEGGSSLNSA